MNSKRISSYEIAYTYIGAVIGAGFASGQEIFQFFTVFGVKGLFGIALSTILYIFFGYIIMDLGSEIHGSSYIDILRFSSGKYFSTFMDMMITFFLFMSVISMFAGAGALFEQQFSISTLWGSILMAFITTVTILSGMNGIIHSMSALVPFLLFFIIATSTLSILSFPISLSDLNLYHNPSNLIRNWLLSTVLYFSYNIVIAISVLVPIGGKIKNKNLFIKGSILGGLTLGICCLLINFSLIRIAKQVSTIEIPMLYIAGKISPLIQFVYICILFMSIYTTAVGSAFGFINRILNTTNKYSKLFTIGMMLIAFLFSNVGFSNLVKYVYPIEGYIGILLLICLLKGKIKLTVKQKR
ncbi:hypothetical protein [Garciella nitratireducens]|uniref:YkvI family membrane protein n=1 Tax=Garciella nitratireducens TaxID=218205 RepID=UPI000DE905DD|nr:hypothetical protein [Garciella nitratireducens]RBP46821.1 putative membrane protein YkvI [Garciella nitratireducens]